MNKAHAKKPVHSSAPKGKGDPFSLDAARIAYISSPRRIDLAKLAKVFESAPDEVECSGALPKPKR